MSTHTYFQTINLEKRYVNYFGDTPPFPPQHIMASLVQMKEDGSFEAKLEKIQPYLPMLREEIETFSGEAMSPFHSFFDVQSQS